jgi:pyruvate ferredoxin oxidoreductase alpha subunit
LKARARSPRRSRCARPEVICAYPISPQTHIVEGLGELVKSGQLSPCEFVNVESEFAAMSVAIGASAAGARAYTATASQGLLFMAEAVYNASGLGLPIVMTVANRAIGAPINIWNDHSDSMSQRDCGWIQLFAETNQEAPDLHIQAFKLAEELSMPVMVCMDGFILTHAVRARGHARAGRGRRLPAALRAAPGARPGRAGVHRRDGRPRGLHGGALPGARQADHGAGAHPADRRRVQASASAADAGGLVRPYRCEDAETIVVALGSVLGTLKDTVDELRQTATASACWASVVPALPAGRGARGAAGRAARGGAGEELLGGPGRRGVDRRAAGAVTGVSLHGYTVIAGLGGRAITKASLSPHAARGGRRPLPALTFLDLDHGIVERQLERERRQRRSGPIAEALLRDIGTVASKVN